MAVVGNAWLLPFPVFFSCVLPAGTHTYTHTHTWTPQGDKCSIKCYHTLFSPEEHKRATSRFAPVLCNVLVLMSQAAFSLSLEMLVVASTLWPVCFGSEETPPSSSLNYIKGSSLMRSWISSQNRRIVKTERDQREAISKLSLAPSFISYLSPLHP